MTDIMIIIIVIIILWLSESGSTPAEKLYSSRSGRTLADYSETEASRSSQFNEDFRLRNIPSSASWGPFVIS